MQLSTILMTFSFLPALSSRPFLATFSIAMLARFLERIIAPDWFIAPLTLMVLGAVAAVEVFAQKESQLRLFFNETDQFVKALAAIVVTFSLVDPDAVAIIEATVGPPSMIEYLFQYGWAAVSGFVAWVMSSYRNAIFSFIGEFDEDDDLGIQTMLSWAEDSWVISMVVIGVFVPVIALIMYGVILLGFYLLQRSLEEQDEKSKRTCGTCGMLIYPHAPTCPNCGQKNEALYGVGVFGQATRNLVADRAIHRYNLISRKRCPDCAHRLEDISLDQRCPHCQRVLFSNTAEMDGYLKYLNRQLIPTVLVCAAVSWIPFLGLAIGIVYYRLTFISGLRRYVPKHIGCVTRFGLRFWNLLLIGLQPIPFVGAVTLPLMCYTNFALYKRILEGQKEANLPPPKAATVIS